MKERLNGWKIVVAVLIVATAFALPAFGQDVVIAMQAEPHAIDPHFSTSGPSQRIAEHIFDRLFMPDDKDLLAPALGLSWKRLDALTVEVKLRPNVRFQDGSPLTADDVVFSMERIPTVPNSPASFAKDVQDVLAKAIDPLTVRFSTPKPNPLLMQQISRVYIVSKKYATGATTADFNSGKAAIGTGPYRFVEWRHGERIVLKRNDDYYGNKPYAVNVTIKMVPNDAARVASLLSGDADLIDVVPPSDIEMLRRNNKVSLWPVPASTVIYIHMDSNRDVTPFATDERGNPLPKNPLKDARVREALSLLIDRDLLVDRILQDMGTPTIQLVPKGYIGYVAGLEAPKVNVARAKQLLTEAGYPKGFGLTLHSANDRYTFQPEVVQAVAQFLARGGINVKVETMPTNVFLPKATAREYSFFLLGYGNSTGEGTTVISAVIATNDKAKNMGGNNRGDYSNPAIDELMGRALVEMDDVKRGQLVQEASRIAAGDTPIIPLYIQTEMFATRKGLVFKPGVGLPRTNAMDLKLERR